MIYLDHAATSLERPEEVCQAVTDSMKRMGNPSRGVHGPSLEAGRMVYRARRAVAELFGCDAPSCVAFTSNVTEALNTAIYGIFSPMLEQGEPVRIISTDLEHNSVLRPLYSLQDRGARLAFVPADRRGRISLDEMERMITPDTRGIVCTHGSNLTGNLLDLYRIGEIAGRHGIPLVVDAAQTAGVFPIHMKEMGIQVLCFTGHKSLMGPQGTGGICVREGMKIRGLKAGGSGVHSFCRHHPAEMPEALEAGTLNVHGIAGLLAGIQWIRKTGMETIREKEMNLAKAFYHQISGEKAIHVYGDWENFPRAPIVTLNVDGIQAARLADRLWTDYAIAVRAGAHCAPRMHQALGTEETGAVRFSFSWFNTMQQVETAAAALKEMIAERGSDEEKEDVGR